MDDPLPNFDSPTEPTEPAPRKPRQRPTRRKRVSKPAAVKTARKLRKRRVVRQKPAESHHGGRFTPEVYRLIGQLMGLDTETRNLVVEVAKGLSK